MANTLLTPDIIVARALARLANNTVFAGLVSRDWESAFAGAQGDTVNVRRPPVFTAKVFTEAIEVQSIAQTKFPVVLDTHLDVSVEVTSKELTLEIEDFDELVLEPMCAAIIEGIDFRIAEALATVARGAGGGGIANGATTPSDAFVDARTILGRANFPLTDRAAVLSPEGSGKVLKEDTIKRVDASGTSDALRDANLGRLSTFPTYETGVLGSGPGLRGETDGVAFHKSAVSLVSRALEKPEGVPAELCSIQSYKSFGLRCVRGYDIVHKKDIVSLDVLIGVAGVPGREKGVVELEFGQGS